MLSSMPDSTLSFDHTYPHNKWAVGYFLNMDLSARNEIENVAIT
jgi:hypothetical protein